MRSYESDYSLDHYPTLAPVVKGLCGMAVVGVLVACYVTAGPGNAYALAQKPEAGRIELPRMEVVGSRTNLGQSVASVSCSKGA